MSTAPPPLSEADYDAIESAVMETMRGRWFLAEYARRNRNADTTMLITALERIEAALGGDQSVKAIDRIRFDIVEMAKAIARTKAEIASIKPDAEHQGKFGEATEELDSIVHATEGATSDILAAAEQIQEVAWTLREQGLEAEICDLLDSKATDVYTACSFQDLTGQRTQKVIQVLRYLEARINAMITIWGLGGAMVAGAAESARAREGEAALLNGPALPGQGLDQSDVDVVMRPAEAANAPVLTKEPPVARMPAGADRHAPEPPAPEAPAAEKAEAVAEPAWAPPAPAEPIRELAPEALASEAPAPEAPAPEAPAPEAPPLQPAAEVTPAPREPAAQTRAASPGDPLAAVTALSYEEKIALFT